MTGSKLNRDIATETLLALLRSEPVGGVSDETWRAVADLARKQRLAPFLSSRIKKLGFADQVPSDVVQELRREYIDTAQRNARVYHTLAGLLKAFQSEDIPCIPLKGIYLAEHVYDNIAVRPMQDVDLLVKKNDLAHVDELMVDSGFVHVPGDPGTDEQHVHLLYLHKVPRYFVEVHWDLMNQNRSGVRTDIDGVWDRSRATLIAGVPVFEMTAEDQILHLCVHAAKHDYMQFGLNGVVDLAETLACHQGAIDWECLCRRSLEWRAERCLFVGVYLAARLLNASVPEAFMSRLIPPHLNPLYLLIYEENVFLGNDWHRKLFAPTRNFARFWAANTLIQKIQLLWQFVFPPHEEMAAMYPVPPGSRRMLLYYPVRLRDLLKRYARAFWHLYGSNDGLRSQAENRVQTVLMRDWLFSKRDE